MEKFFIFYGEEGIFINNGKLEKVRAVVINITELRRLEMLMARADKLEPLGVLAGGIDHDFDNMLLRSVITVLRSIIHDIPEDVGSRHHLEASVRSTYGHGTSPNSC